MKVAANPPMMTAISRNSSVGISQPNLIDAQPAARINISKMALLRKTLNRSDCFSGSFSICKTSGYKCSPAINSPNKKAAPGTRVHPYAAAYLCDCIRLISLYQTNANVAAKPLSPEARLVCPFLRRFRVMAVSRRILFVH